MDNTLKILEYAMTLEQRGQQFYLKYKNEFESKSAKQLFENLANVEAEHYNILKKERDKFAQDGKLDQLDVNLSEGDKIFEAAMKQEKIQMDPESVPSMSDLTIMRLAYLIENDFAEFYKNAVNKTDSPAAKKLLSSLAEWENGHRELFYNEYRELMEIHWEDQRFAPY